MLERKNLIKDCFPDWTLPQPPSVIKKFQLVTRSSCFFEFFKKIDRRTGAHIPTGTIFSKKLEFSNAIPNHEFNNYIYRYFEFESSGK